MTFNSYNIFLNKGVNGYFLAGDFVTGTITLVFKNSQSFQELECRVIGICKAQWTRPSPTIPYIKNYSGTKKVLDVELNIFDHFKGKTVNIGVESIPFQFMLPTDLPSTFKSSLAEVKYFIKLKSKAILSLFKLKKIVPFIVIGKVNLNHLEEFMTPSFYKIDKKFRLSGQITICFKTLKGFAPTQNVPFEIIICNKEKVRITKINIDLIQKIKYNVASGHASQDKKVCKVTFKINSNTIKQHCKFSMDIPGTLPSSIHVIDPVVDISYFFRLEVVFPFHFTRYEDIPVIVATEPVLYNNIEDDFRSASFISRDR